MNRVKRNPLLRLGVAAALGLGALVAVLATFVVQRNQDIRPILMIEFTALFAAVLLSPKDGASPAWPGDVAVVLGCIIPALLLSYFGLAFIDHFYLAAFLVTPGLSVALAMAARTFKTRRQTGAAFMIAVALAAAGLGAFRLVPSLEDRFAYLSVERTFEPFSVHTLDGKEISSGTWRGRVVVLSYWATWCPPCLAEMPKIAVLADHYRSDPKVAIISLNAGYGGDTPEKAIAFLQRHNFALSSEIDDIRTKGATKGVAAASLGLKVVPTLFILDPSGRLVAIHTGYDNSENLLATLTRRIDQLR
jgi:thiol-disulfide isomerase/thioredoxin